MPLLPASTGKRELWKNGLGSTLVVASDATTVGGDDWSWRLAIADIPSRCAFSNYVGIDRCIALLEGAGLAIERGDRRQDLPVVGSALAFAGEEEVVGDPTGDGVRDANLMLRRTHWRGEMQLVRSGAMPVDATLVVIHAANGAIEIASAHEPSIARIESGETLITHGAVEVRPLLGACAIICTMCPANSSLPSTSLVPLREALRVWAYIGVNSFGGPTAQIALMHRVIVDERKWLGEDRFLHALNFCMLLPGPEAMQLATYIGWLKSRTLGGLIAGCCFVLPGFLALLALSIAYTAWSDVTVVQGMLFGLKAAVLAIIAHAMIRIGTRVLKTSARYLIALGSFIALFFFDAPFPVIVGVVAIVGLLGARVCPAQFGITAAVLPSIGEVEDHTQPNRSRSMSAAAFWLTMWLAPVAMLALCLGPENIFASQAWFFSKAAVVTVGGAYSVLAYIAQQAVEVHQWVTPAEMLTGLGFAETTPGPLILVAQFVGYIGAYRDPGALHPIVAGVLASVIVTWVTYAPCFLWIFVGGPFVEKLRSNRSLCGAMATIPAAVVGIILSLSVWLAANTLFGTVEESSWGGLGVVTVQWLTVDWASIDLAALGIAMLAAVALFRLRWSITRTLAFAVALGVVRML